MGKKDKLLALRNKLETLQNPAESFRQSLIAKQIEQITEKVTDNQTLKNLAGVQTSLNSLRNDLAQSKEETTQSLTSTQTQLTDQMTELIAQIQTSLETVQEGFAQSYQDLVSEFETRLNNLPQTPDLTQEVAQIKQEFTQRIDNLPKDDDSAIEADIQTIRQQFQDYVLADEQDDLTAKAETSQALGKLKQEILTRLANLGGGQANRALYFNGVDRLTRYTDINWKAGSNVTFTIANNDQTKKVDVTISATGGGGGSTRLITSVNTNTAAGSSSGTDYVYLCSGTMTLTLPDATASNTNLYTIKNVGTGIVTINTTSAQTIDGALTQIMPIQFTSIDVISDTANWSIT